MRSAVVRWSRGTGSRSHGSVGLLSAMCGRTAPKSPRLPGAGKRLWMRSGGSVNRGPVASTSITSLSVSVKPSSRVSRTVCRAVIR